MRHNKHVDLITAQAHLNAWLAADLAIAQGQEYEIDTGGTKRRLRRADADLVKKNIEYWNSWVSKLTPGKNKMRLVVNRD